MQYQKLKERLEKSKEKTLQKIEKLKKTYMQIDELIEAINKIKEE